jgi:hypothetical protein
MPPQSAPACDKNMPIKLGSFIAALAVIYLSLAHMIPSWNLPILPDGFTQAFAVVIAFVVGLFTKSPIDSTIPPADTLAK